MSHRKNFNSLFQRFYVTITKDGQRISLQIFPFDLFVKEAYYIVEISHKHNGLSRNNRLLI